MAIAWHSDVHSIKSFAEILTRDQIIGATLGGTVVVVAAVLSVEWRRSNECEAVHGSRETLCAKHTRNVHTMIFALFVVFVVGIAHLGQISKQTSAAPSSTPNDIEDLLNTKPTHLENVGSKKQKTKKKQSKKDATRQWYDRSAKKFEQKKERRLKVQHAEAKAAQKARCEEVAHEKDVLSMVSNSEDGAETVEFVPVEAKNTKKKIRKAKKIEAIEVLYSQFLKTAEKVDGAEIRGESTGGHEDEVGEAEGKEDEAGEAGGKEAEAGEASGKEDEAGEADGAPTDTIRLLRGDPLD